MTAARPFPQPVSVCRSGLLAVVRWSSAGSRTAALGPAGGVGASPIGVVDDWWAANSSIGVYRHPAGAAVASCSAAATTAASGWRRSSATR
jgi:hypothetical protein